MKPSKIKVKKCTLYTVLYFPLITTHTDSIRGYLLTPFSISTYENMHNYCKQGLTSLFSSPLRASETVHVKLKPLLALSDIVN